MIAPSVLAAPARRPGFFDWLRRELAPFPGRGATTARIVVTVVLVLIISMALQVPEAVLSAYMVFFVTKENKVVTALTGVLLMVGVTLAIAVSLLVYRYTFDFPELRVPAIAAVLFLGFYFSRVFALGPLAFGIGFVIAATQSIAELMPSAEYLVRTLLWLWVVIVYPIALTVVVNQVLLPAQPRAILVRELQRRLDAVIGVIERKLGIVAVDERADKAVQELATRGSAGLLKLLTLAEMAELSQKRNHAAHAAAILASEHAVTAAFAVSLMEGVPLSPGDRRCLESIRAEAARLRAAVAQPMAVPAAADADASWGAALPEIQDLQRAIALFRENLEARTDESAAPASGPRPRKRLIAADALTNPAHARFGLKVTLAAMTCYLFYTGVDWAGIHTAFITCCFIALENTGATRRKGTLRLAGCVVGGLMGFLSILYLIPRMESIASLVVLVAAATATAGWVAAGSERIAYAGLQIALAFYMCVLQGFAPDTDFNKIRDRIVGILLGIAVTTLVFRYVWPERAMDRLRLTVGKTLRKIARLLTSADIDAGSLRGEITKDLDESFGLIETAAFEEEESGISTGPFEAVATQARGIFLTATLLTSDAATVEWQHLPEAARRAETDLRNAAAAELESAAARVTGAAPEERVDMEARLAAWNGVIAGAETPQGGRVMLLRRLAVQVVQAGGGQSGTGILPVGVPSGGRATISQSPLDMGKMPVPR